MKAASFLAGLLLASTATGWAAEVFVEPATGTGVTESDRATVTELVRSAVVQEGESLAEGAGKARIVLRPKFMKLGGSRILFLEKLKDGKSVFRIQQKVFQMEDVEELAQPMTRAVLREEKLELAADLDGALPAEPVDDSDNDYSQFPIPKKNHDKAPAPVPARKRTARKGGYFAFGPAVLDRLNAPGVAYSFAGAFLWDVDRAVIKLLADLSASGDAMLASMGLGGNFFFLSGNTTPYAGADIGVGFAKVHTGSLFSGELVGGFTLGLGGGVVMFRNSSVNMDLGLRGVILLNPNTLGYPLGLALRLGIYF